MIEDTKYILNHYSIKYTIHHPSTRDTYLMVNRFYLIGRIPIGFAPDYWSLYQSLEILIW